MPEESLTKMFLDSLDRLMQDPRGENINQAVEQLELWGKHASREHDRDLFAAVSVALNRYWLDVLDL
ncbi:MAG: hypothetical protein GTN64_05530 [Candidatus Latescibacteria bacterium]|nr:hypothetical protein [Candidatus Latescibacterota bacterium]NIO78070.1 hypothetical protein [Candidatus Latescibacterota bacterium]